MLADKLIIELRHELTITANTKDLVQGIQRIRAQVAMLINEIVYEQNLNNTAKSTPSYHKLLSCAYDSIACAYPGNHSIRC